MAVGLTPHSGLKFSEDWKFIHLHHGDYYGNQTND
jgi:hypothetical protein